MTPFNDRIHKSLPIYSLRWEDKYFLYTPGLKIHLESEKIKNLENAFLTNKTDHLTEELRTVFFNLTNHSIIQKEKFNSQKDKEFIPECLTINISNHCNLNCNYCYTRPDTQGQGNDQTISKNAVEAAARLVAANCKLKGRPFTVVFHGGGEPTYHWEYLKELFLSVKIISRSFKIPLFSYISTNGFFNEEKAVWLAKNFSLIGISYDGPDEIHDLNRKTIEGKKTSDTVARTIKTIIRNNGNIEIRSTISPEIIQFQGVIVKYLVDELSVKNIRFEPKYGGNGTQFSSADADPYFSHFISAEHSALTSGGRLDFSGIRLKEIHGTYCDVLRNNLRIGPDNRSRNCFYDSNSDPSNVTGNYDKERNRFVLDIKSIEDFIIKVSGSPRACCNCFLEYHCSKGCPDYCRNNAGKNNLSDFRCLLHRKLGLYNIACIV